MVSGIFRSDDGAVRLQPYRVIIPCADGHDVRPAGYVALAIVVISHGDDGAVRLQTHRI